MDHIHGPAYPLTPGWAMGAQQAVRSVEKSEIVAFIPSVSSQPAKKADYHYTLSC